MNKLIFVLVVVLFTISLSAQSLKENPDAIKAFKEGDKLRKSGQYAAAIEKYDEVLKLAPDFQVYYTKGVTQKKLKQFKESIESFENALKIKNDFDLAHNALGGSYFAMGNYLKAVEHYEAFEKLSTKKKQKEAAKKNIAIAYTKLAFESKQNGNYDKAIEYLNTALSNAKYDSAFLALAELHIDKGNYEEAIKAADEANNNRDTISKGAAFYFKGVAFKKLGDTQKAKENFLEAAKDPTYKTNSNYELKLMN